MMLRPSSTGAPPLIGTRASVPPVMFMVPPAVRSASSPRRDMDARPVPERPRLRDSGLAGSVTNNARGRPHESAEYTTLSPFGVKRAPQILPRWNVIWRKVASVGRGQNRATARRIAAIRPAEIQRIIQFREGCCRGRTAADWAATGSTIGARGGWGNRAMNREPVLAAVSELRGVPG